jgi:hypothetical protein
VIHPDRHLLERTLMLYARLYLANLPRSRTHSIDALRPLERLLCELLGDPDWHATDTWFDPGVVDFLYADDEADIALGATYTGTDEPIGPMGKCARISVNVATKTFTYRGYPPA